MRGRGSGRRRNCKSLRFTAPELAHQGGVDRKQVETLNLVCQHEFGIDISNG